MLLHGLYTISQFFTLFICSFSWISNHAVFQLFILCPGKHAFEVVHHAGLKDLPGGDDVFSICTNSADAFGAAGDDGNFIFEYYRMSLSRYR